MDASILEAVTLDVSSWLDGDEDARNLVAYRFDVAFRSFGLVLVTGYPGQDAHEETSQALVKEAGAFFATSLEEKMRWNNGPYGSSDGGYTPPGLESVARSIGLQQKDHVESFTFTAHPSSFAKRGGECPFQATAAQYYEGMCGALRLIHSIAARALDVAPAFFDDCYFDTPPDAGANGLAFKISWYRQEHGGRDEADAAVPEPRLRYGEHTDYQGFTLLKPDCRDWRVDAEGCSGGLEFKHGDEWVPVAIPATLGSSLVVNAGDLVRVWSNDRWMSPIHRVRASTRAVPEERCSLVFFTGPAANTLVVPICKAGEAPLHAPVLAGEHLQRKLKATQDTQRG